MGVCWRMSGVDFLSQVFGVEAVRYGRLGVCIEANA